MKRKGFTLVELMIVCAIMAIMATLVVFAMFGATEAAKKQKTEALVARIDAVLRNKWESYQTRRVPFDLTGASSAVAGRAKIDALHDLMRMELPDRWTDVTDDPKAWAYAGPFNMTLTRSAVSQGYLRRWIAAQIGMAGKPTLAQAQEYQGAECLYLILQAAGQEEGDDVSVILRPDNIADIDQDGFPEIVDGWRTPIRFLRWPVGFTSDQQVVARGTVSSQQTPAPAPSPTNLPTQTFDSLISFGTNPVPPNEALSPGLSDNPANYVGGAIVALNSAGIPQFDRMARITGYQYFPLQTMPMFQPAFARFTCSTSTNTTMQPFAPGGGPPPIGDKYVVMAPDPFDHARVYPVYPPGAAPVNPDLSKPTFATFPLVYSAGPDKSYGVIGDTSTTLRYVTQNVNPFYVPGNFKPMGYQEAIPGENGDWKDNIHNHALGRR